MNLAPDQTSISGLQIFLDHSSIGQKISMILPPRLVAEQDGGAYCGTAVGGALFMKMVN